jgi:hypothetical protein
MFHKGKVGYDFLGEAAENRTHWLDCRMAKWNLAGKCSDVTHYFCHPYDR